VINADQLHKLSIGAQWVDRFNISTVVQQSAFIGQCQHECNNFRTLQENLNYRPETLVKLWPQRFPMDVANEYAHKEQRIANKVYANRMGNRDEQSGDGWRFHGRGCIQLTGHDSYFHAGRALGVDFVSNPDMVADPKWAALTAGWFWSTHNCNALADAQDWTALTKKINGGTFGLDERINNIRKAILILS
jgi:putative chitinase